MNKQLATVTFDNQQNVFHLSNKSISYLIEIEEGGLLSHLYFGKKIEKYHGQRHYPRIDRGHSGNLAEATNRTFSKDTLLQEFSGNNTGDYRTPGIIIKGNNGSRSVDLRYKSYDIKVGKPDIKDLPQSYVKSNNDAMTLIIHTEDKSLNAKVDLFYTIYSEFPVITRHIEVTNNSNEKFNLEKVTSMQLDFPKQDLEVISLPGSYAREREIERQKLNRGTLQFESRRGASSHQMNPFIALVNSNTNEFSGTAIGSLLIYSGNHQFTIEKDQINQTRLSTGINEYNFDWLLNPSEKFTAPEAVLTYTENGLNGMSNIFHSFLNNYVARGNFQNKSRPILINNWEATYFDFNENKINEILDTAKPLGIEMFVLDDGWFGHRNNDKTSLGDWVENIEKLPHGLKGISKNVHNHQMQFGLWFEPEMISEESDLFKNNKNIRLGDPTRSLTKSRDQYLLDFSSKKVVNLIFKKITKILDSVEIDYIKWDFNRYLSEVFSVNTKSENEGMVSHQFILGVYQLMDMLTKRYPTILFEGCTGGGGRFDAGLLYYMPQSWPSDNNDPIQRLKIQYGTSLVYPISSITSHVGASPDEMIGRNTSMSLRGNVASSGTLGYELDLSTLSSSELTQIKQQTSFYKKHRELIQYGSFYRLESPFKGDHTAWMFVDKEKTEFLLFNFVTLANAQNDFHITKLIGLNADESYIDEQTNEVFNGDELMQIGLYDNPIQSKDFSSSVRYFKSNK